MRVRAALFITAVAHALAYGEEPPAGFITVPPPPPPPPPPAVADAPPGGAWFDVDSAGEPFFGVDLMLGQQTGVRGQVAVWRGERSALVVEGFYGGLATRLGQSEAAGGGLRWLFARCRRGGADAVVLGPGVDVFSNFADGEATILVPTLDVAWRHSFGERSGWTIGLSAGVGIGIGGRDDDRDSAAGQATPLISVFGGLRF